MTTTPNAQFMDCVGGLTKKIGIFAAERDWSQYHLPRSLVLALMGEVGELSELLQFRTDGPEELAPQLVDKLSQEMADVSIYLLRLADVCHCELPVNATQTD